MCLTVVVIVSLVWFRRSLQRPSRSNITVVVPLHQYDPNAPTCTDSSHFERALISWFRFAEEVVLVADALETCSAVRKRFRSQLHCVVHDCASEIGIPTVRCLYATGSMNAKTDLVLFMNHDIEMEGPIADLGAAFSGFPGRFVLFGQRFDYDACVTGTTRSHIELHATWGLDYFLLRPSDFPVSDMPDFVIGNWRWDNWLARYFIEKEDFMAVDATAVLVAWHPRPNKFVSASERSGAAWNNALGMGMFREDFKTKGRSDLSPYILRYSRQSFVLCNRSLDLKPAPWPCAAIPFAALEGTATTN